MTSHQRSIYLALLLASGLAAGAASAQPAAPADPAQAPAAPAAQAPPAATPTEAKPAPVPAPAVAGRIAAPPAGKGQVVFFRPSKYAGWALSFSIHEGDTGVGKLGNGSYFVLAADPGPHAYSIQGEATDTLNLEVEADETQYVQQTIGIGIVMGRPHLTPSDQATFDHFDPKSMKLSDKKPTDLKTSAVK